MDQHAILQGQALQVLDLTEMIEAQRSRLAEILAEAARRLRHRLLLNPDPDLWDVELGEALAELEMWMEGLAGYRDGETG